MSGDRPKLSVYSNECRDMGIRILQPDVNSSVVAFHPHGNAIRFGLGAIKHVGEPAAAAIVAAAQRLERFRSFDQFRQEVDGNVVNKRAIQGLIKGGAMDSLGLGRAGMTARLNASRQSRRRNGSNGNGRTISANDTRKASPLLSAKPADESEWSPAERLAGEKDALGIYVSGHPLDSYRERLIALKPDTISLLQELDREGPHSA